MVMGKRKSCGESLGRLELRLPEYQRNRGERGSAVSLGKVDSMARKSTTDRSTKK